MALMKFREKNRAAWVGVRPGHNGEQVDDTKVINNSTAIVYTVPAGKTLYLCNINVSVYTNVAGGFYVAVRDAGDANAEYFYRGISHINLPVPPAIINWRQPREIPTGYDLFGWSGADGLYVNIYWFGWIE